MRNLKVIISYNGAAYHGWQRQHNRITVQETIEEKMGISPSKFLKKMYYGDVMRNKMLTTNTKIINKVLRKLPMIFPHRQDYLLFNPTIIHEWNKIIEQITQDI